MKDVFIDNNIQKCDFLKVDCEGTEYEILYSPPRDIFERIESITIEYHEQFGTGKGTELKDFLVQQGYNVSLQEGSPGYIYAEKNYKAG